jgi:hypothetical protein
MFWRDLIGYFFYIPAFELFRSELRVMREKYGGSNGRPANDGACEASLNGLLIMEKGFWKALRSFPSLES